MTYASFFPQECCVSQDPNTFKEAHTIYSSILIKGAIMALLGRGFNLLMRFPFVWVFCGTGGKDSEGVSLIRIATSPLASPDLAKWTPGECI